MRSLEIVLIVMLLAVLGSYIVPANKRPRWVRYLPSLTLLIAMVQLAVEQYRWQMVPAYFLSGVFFLISLMLLGQRPAATAARARWRRRIARIAGMAVVFLVWVVAVALPALIPIPQLPEPTGRYAIGTHTFEWVDNRRPETFSSDPTSHRDLVIQVWYPAEKVIGARPTAFWPDARMVGAAYAKAGLPPFFFDHLALASTHSYLDAPPAQAEKTYPVLIFSHGYGLLVNQNTPQMEELASQGYVVFSIAHPYEARVTIYPDGRAVPLSEAQLQQQASVDIKALQALEDQFRQAADSQTSEAIIRKTFVVESVMQPSLKIWTDDAVFVLDEIERLNRGEFASVLAGHLNLDQIGLFGHSFGGTTAGEVCMRDKRCKAGVNMDGLQWGEVLDQPLSQPFMTMHSTIPGWVTNRAGQNMNDVIYSRGHNPVYRLSVMNTAHFNYTDMSFISPLFKMLGVVGGIDGDRMETIMNHYLVAFFNKHLKGLDSPALSGPDSLYPDVDVRVRQP